MAIIRQMADEEDWLLGTDLQAARKELRDVKAWLAAVEQKKQAPASPHAKTLTVSRYGFLREIRVRIRRKVVEDISENQISNSKCESEGLRKPKRRSGGGPKGPRVGRASVYLVRAGTKWNMCA